MAAEGGGLMAKELHGWQVRKTADALTPGDRIIFSEEMGGEGEVLTVEGISNSFGTIEIATEELDFELMASHNQFISIDLTEYEDRYTDTVTHLRVFDEGDGWVLDAADDAGKYSTGLWKFDTKAEALEHAQKFTECLKQDGYTLPEGELPLQEID
jgi:hypothetical protein